MNEANPISAPATAVPTPLEWRAAMGYFPTGVTIVTTWRDGSPMGSTVNAFCSVSLDPPMLLVCLDLANPTRPFIEQCGVFGVNILGEDSGDLARRFGADPRAESAAAYRLPAIGLGAPQLKVAPVFIDCVLDASHCAGDHFIMVGRGTRIDRSSAHPPLLYHQGGFPKLGAKG